MDFNTWKLFYPDRTKEDFDKIYLPATPKEEKPKGVKAKKKVTVKKHTAEDSGQPVEGEKKSAEQTDIFS
jgi:hypothetical protein